MLLKEKIDQAEAGIIGGAGLSGAAGPVYDGERLDRYFSGFRRKYGFRGMYTAYGIQEEFRAAGSRHIRISRCMDAPKSTRGDLYQIVKNRDCFLLTTNVDLCSRRAGIDWERLFCTRGIPACFRAQCPAAGSHGKTGT